MPQPEIFLLICGVLLLAAILLQRLVPSRFGVPILILFLLIGMLAGGKIAFNDYHAANFIGSFALSFILYTGGLETGWRSVRPSLFPAGILATAGVLLTAILLALFARFVFGWEWIQSLLLGTIVSSTDAAAVFSILRSKGVSLRGGLKPLLELESGSNDPMAIFLTMLVVGIAGATTSAGTLIAKSFGLLLWNFAFGAGAGVAIGLAACWGFKKIKAAYDGLYPVLSIGIVLFSYGAVAALKGNGFLALYIAGIVIGNKSFPNKRMLISFHNGFSWLMQVALFITLGLLVTPAELPSVLLPGLLAAIFMMFAARPIAVFACLPKVGKLRNLTRRDKLMISWTGLRGAVPIVMATLPITMGLDPNHTIFNTVFFIVVTSVLLQGMTLMPVARLLHLAAPLHETPKSPLEFERQEGMESDTREISIPVGSAADGTKIAALGLPPQVLILIIRRGKHFITPRGNTLLKAADMLTVLAPSGKLDAIERWIKRDKDAAAPPTWDE